MTFCTVCGSEKEVEYVSTGFHSGTGQPAYQTKQTCSYCHRQQNNWRNRVSELTALPFVVLFWWIPVLAVNIYDYHYIPGNAHAAWTAAVLWPVSVAATIYVLRKVLHVPAPPTRGGCGDWL